MDTPLVSVIILNYNGRQYLEDCLSSLGKQTYKDFEAILVDNGSRDDSASFVKTHYANLVRLIELPENRGFSGGNNVGIKSAKGKYIALLNNDTEVDVDWLKNLVQYMDGDEQTGMVGSKILNFYKRDEIDNIGHLIYPDGLNRGRGRLEQDHGQFDTKMDILFPSGCAALYRKSMLEDVGGFDEAFFAYGDDTDIGLYGRYLRYKAVYCPKAIVYHKYSGTAGSYSAMKVFYVERNRVWVLVKYFPLSSILVSPWYSIKRFVLQGYGILTKKGAAGRLSEKTPIGSIIKTIIRAYISALRGLPEMTKKRKRIFRKKRISILEIKRLLRSHRISCREISLKD